MLLMTRAPQKDRARIQERFVTEFVENHSSYWLFFPNMPKNFVDLRNKIHVSCVSNNGARKCCCGNEFKPKNSCKVNRPHHSDNKWTLVSIILKNFYITMKYLEGGSSDRCKFAPAKPGAVEDSRGPFMTG